MHVIACGVGNKLASGERSHFGKISTRKAGSGRYCHHSCLERNLKIIELAEIAQISPYHFIRLFKNSIGKTPHQYILQCRIEKGKYLLQQTQLSIEAIAASLGFCDPKATRRVIAVILPAILNYFKRLTGLTPKQLQAKSQ